MPKNNFHNRLPYVETTSGKCLVCFNLVFNFLFVCLQLIDNQKKVKSKNSLLVVGGVIAVASVLLFAYLMWYVAPEENIERVKVVAVTAEGCIVETSDGYAVNIGSCNAQPDEYIVAPIDQKLKERAASMNPTS